MNQQEFGRLIEQIDRLVTKVDKLEVEITSIKLMFNRGLGIATGVVLTLGVAGTAAVSSFDRFLKGG